MAAPDTERVEKVAREHELKVWPGNESCKPALTVV